MGSTPFRYQSPEEDSARWLGFPFRDGDIVISTRSKTGTTWVQMICALLIFGEPQLPAPLGRLSPWLDHLVTPREKVFALLAAQQHRRFIKTHTPLDGLPLDPRVSYLVAARHPLDMAVSLYHHHANIDKESLRRQIGGPEPPARPPQPEPLHEWLLWWIGSDTGPAGDLDSLPFLMWHFAGAWARRLEPNILLVHYANLCADLDGQMRWLAGRLGINIPVDDWPALVRAATFENMSRNADQLVPAPGLFKSNAAFFRRGRSGAGHEILSSAEIARYHARVSGMAPPTCSPGCTPPTLERRPQCRNRDWPGRHRGFPRLSPATGRGLSPAQILGHHGGRRDDPTSRIVAGTFALPRRGASALAVCCRLAGTGEHRRPQALKDGAGTAR